MKKRYISPIFIMAFLLITVVDANSQQSGITIGLEHRVLFHEFNTGNLIGIQISKEYRKSELGLALYHSLNDYLFSSGLTPFGLERDELTNLKYGGLTAGVNLLQRNTFLIKGSVLIGLGNFDRTTQDFDLITQSPEVFYLVEPGIETGINISRWLQFTLGTRYLLSFTSINDKFSDIDSFLITAKFSLRV